MFEIFCSFHSLKMTKSAVIAHFANSRKDGKNTIFLFKFTRNQQAKSANSFKTALTRIAYKANSQGFALDYRANFVKFAFTPLLFPFFCVALGQGSVCARARFVGLPRLARPLLSTPKPALNSVCAVARVLWLHRFRWHGHL